MTHVGRRCWIDVKECVHSQMRIQHSRTGIDHLRCQIAHAVVDLEKSQRYGLILTLSRCSAISKHQRSIYSRQVMQEQHITIMQHLEQHHLPELQLRSAKCQHQLDQSLRTDPALMQWLPAPHRLKHQVSLLRLIRVHMAEELGTQTGLLDRVSDA